MEYGKKRIAIACFYNKKGVVGDYFLHMLDEIRKISHCLIVVVNGKVLEKYRQKLQEHVDKVVIRENIGFDSGAYKDVILKICDKDVWKEANELILFNNSVYGQIMSITSMKVDDLKAAQIHPEKHKSLRVRMGGLSAYFVQLASVAQDSIIKRFDNNFGVL